MRPAKTVHTPRHIKGFDTYQKTPSVDLEPLEDEAPQVSAGTVPKNTAELGHKGRGMAGR